MSFGTRVVRLSLLNRVDKVPSSIGGNPHVNPSFNLHAIKILKEKAFYMQWHVLVKLTDQDQVVVNSRSLFLLPPVECSCDRSPHPDRRRTRRTWQIHPSLGENGVQWNQVFTYYSG